MSVDQVTEGVASVAIADGTAANPAADGPQDAAVIAVVEEGRRLYIGNLAYATTEEDLGEFFKGYLVESTSIPTNPRTSRPVGYAFVDLATATEAQRAITDLSGKEVLSRKVSVQLARRPETAAEKAEHAAASGEDPAAGGERRRGSGRGRGRGRGRAGRGGRGGRVSSPEKPKTDDVSDSKAQNDEAGEVLPLADTTKEAANAQNVENGNVDADATTPKEAKPRTPRQPKQRGPPEDGIPSKNKVMVANLPYDLSEEKLKELFTDYKPTAAKIALRPIPRFMVKKLQARNEPRKGRGFGFVSLESEEMQQKAVSEMNGKDIDGREIAVKVAIDSPGKEDIDPEAAGTAPLTENGVVQANEPPAEVAAAAATTTTPAAA